MNNDVNNPDIKDEQRQGVSAGIWTIAAVSLLAGVSSGVGAIGGFKIGNNDGVSGTRILFGIIGMLLISGALIWIVSPKWRRHYIASLPLFWLMIGGTLITPLLFDRDSRDTAQIVFIAIAISVGPLIGEFIKNQR